MNGEMGCLSSLMFLRHLLIRTLQIFIRSAQFTIWPNGCNHDFQADGHGGMSFEIGWEKDKQYIIYMDSNKE